MITSKTRSQVTEDKEISDAIDLMMQGKAHNVNPDIMRERIFTADALVRSLKDKYPTDVYMEYLNVYNAALDVVGRE